MRKPGGSATRGLLFAARIGNGVKQLIAPTPRGKCTGFELRLASALLGVKNATLFHSLVLPINGGLLR